MKPKQRISLRVFSVLLLALVACCGFMIWKEASSRRKEKEDFAILVELVQIEPDTPEPTNTAEPEAASKRSLSPLFEQNSDCIGWLSIPGTAVDYPVMYTPYDPQKYLRRSFRGQYSQSGVPFLDRRCSLQSDNLIIYGHNMKNGTMFSDLKRYTNNAFRAEHPTIELETTEGIRYYTVIEVRITDVSDEWYSCINADSDRFLTLSTCYGSKKGGRLIVIAVQN